MRKFFFSLQKHQICLFSYGLQITQHLNSKIVTNRAPLISLKIFQ